LGLYARLRNMPSEVWDGTNELVGAPFERES
jgi:hypothetical protein